MNSITDQKKTEKIQSVGEKVSGFGILLLLTLVVDLILEFLSPFVSDLLLFIILCVFILGAILQKSSYSTKPIVISKDSTRLPG